MRGKTLILTGASRGIGRVLALELARHGVNLVVNARQQAPLAEVASECADLGVKVRQVAGNAADSSVAEAMVAQGLEVGDFYGFIHAAGVLHPGPFLWELSPDQFQEVLESHLVAAYQLIQVAVPYLLQRGEGVAVFFGSYAAEGNHPGIGAYNIAKAAEEHLARQLAQEAPQVVSFVFRPGATETHMQKQAREAGGGAAAMVHQTFRGYHEAGILDSPGKAARRLMHFLLNNPRRYQGRIVA